MKKILVSQVSIDREGIQLPWLFKLKKLENLGCRIFIYGTYFLKEICLTDADVYAFNDNFPELRIFHKKKWTKSRVIFEALKKNIVAILTHRKYIQDQFDVIFSPASVLDLILFPYFFKLFGNKIKWVTVLDNTVPLFLEKKFISGNKLLRILAWLFFRASLLLLRRADCIFVVKPELKTYLKEHGFSENKIVVTGNGVEINLIKRARRGANFAYDAIFVGRINEAKGIYDLLKVLEIVKKSYPDFQLAIMGEGDIATKEKFRKKISDLNLSENIHFLGYITGQKKFDILKSSKCFLFLSETESLPVAPLEAVCSGLPTFVYDLDAFEMYRNNEVIISPKYDVGSVAEKVLDLFRKGNFENKNGQMLLDRYSWEKIAEIEYNAIKNL